MSDRLRLGLDNPAFQGRLRQPQARFVTPVRGPVRQPFGHPVALPAIPKPVAIQAQPTPATLLRPMMTDVRPVTKLKPVAVAKPVVHPAQQLPINDFKVIAPQPFAQPAHPKQQQSVVLRRQAVRNPSAPLLAQAQAQAQAQASAPAKHSKLQYALVGMAVFVFGIGVFVSLITLKTNKAAVTQVAAISAHAQQADGTAAPDSPPTETKPTTSTMASYTVAPDLPRQIIIPKLYVYARVRPMGVNTKNELQAPGNIFDAGWYNASAKPGSGAGSGAMLIDGHVHGPSLPGVFAKIKTLVAGDAMQIVRGDGKIFNYSVVKTQNVEAANLDIGAALTAATPGKAALNLITCGGPYDKASGEYTQRTIVYAVQSDLTAN
ncbi:MAG: class F sortase [Patescibacteria group bacterium]|nr:class F sortase [Patescibacteria group bacterium]